MLGQTIRALVIARKLLRDFHKCQKQPIPLEWHTALLTRYLSYTLIFDFAKSVYMLPAAHLSFFTVGTSRDVIAALCYEYFPRQSVNIRQGESFSHCIKCISAIVPMPASIRANWRMLCDG